MAGSKKLHYGKLGISIAGKGHIKYEIRLEGIKYMIVRRRVIAWKENMIHVKRDIKI